MGQPGRPCHERRRDKEHINGRLGTRGKGGHAEFCRQPIEFVEEIGLTTIAHGRAQSQHGQRVPRQDDRYIDGRNQVGEYQHAVLCYLGVSNTLHATKNRIEEHDRHPDNDTGIDVHLQKPAEDDADTTHLPGHIGERDKDHTNHGNEPGGLRVVSVTNKIRHGEFRELSKVGGKQKREQHITAGPAHQVTGPISALEGNDTCHRQEGRCRHPVRSRRRTVGNRVDMTACNVELVGGRGATPDGNTNIEGKRCTNKEISEELR